MKTPGERAQVHHAAVSRRTLLGGRVAAAAFMIVPRHVLGGAGYTPPSEKLNIAGIGIGRPHGRTEAALGQQEPEGGEATRGESVPAL